MPTALCDPARCREVDPEMWYQPWRVAKAKDTCRRCEVKDACLQLAMSYPDDEQWGVWGGLDSAGRIALRAGDPEAWPVKVAKLDDFYDRVDRYGSDGGDPVDSDPAARGRVPWGEYEGLVRPPVDWAADALEANVAGLMDRYPIETEVGYALTGESGIVPGVKEVAA